MNELSHSSTCSTQSCENGDTAHLRLVTSWKKRHLSGASAHPWGASALLCPCGCWTQHVSTFTPHYDADGEFIGLRCMPVSSDINRSLLKYYYFMCMCKSLCECSYHVCGWCLRRQEGGQDLGFKVIVNSHVRTENHPCVLCKNRTSELSLQWLNRYLRAVRHIKADD